VEAALAGLAFDAAICLMSNREGAVASLALARAGKHLVLEKPGVGSALCRALRHHSA
jgi:hypothetical protein